MNNAQREQIIDEMGEHLFSRLTHFADEDDLQTVDAIYTEWVVDGEDPLDESTPHEFTFIQNFTLSN